MRGGDDNDLTLLVSKKAGRVFGVQCFITLFGNGTSHSVRPTSLTLLTRHGRRELSYGIIRSESEIF